MYQNNHIVQQDPLNELQGIFKGEINQDIIHRTIYSTDASVYKEMPLAVVFPKDEQDIIELVKFAGTKKLSLIPRTAGTSLAGQVVGGGIVVDVSRHLTSIIEINAPERYVWVEPGVNLEELNKVLAEHGLLFGPETSTANRCMIGGMLGNNACGLHSLKYGSTRDHTLAVRGVLSDGSLATFEELDQDEVKLRSAGPNLENRIYRELLQLLEPKDLQEEIRREYPDPGIPRRNTGYAIDLLLDMQPFIADGGLLNLAKLLGGSEGTLVFSTQIKLNLVPLPPPFKAVVCAHFSAIQETLLANLEALKAGPTAVELMDHHILECTKANREQQANRFFVEGNPKTILIIEFAENSAELLQERIDQAIGFMKAQKLGYAYPVVYGEEINKVWNLRKAGLGLLSNEPGDSKSVTVIEDTAVHVKDLPAYIAEIEAVFEKNKMTCVYHAHVGTGELHLRPVLNLKDPGDVGKFKMIAEETLKIVKKYRGSFSGEHGDGRLRGMFIKQFYGERIYEVLKQVKHIFDPQGLFNPGKITETPPMDEYLRYERGQQTPEIDTFFDFSESLGIVRFIEKCNGSGDCRKSHIIGGTMCPSYQATRDEKNTTRARANILREFISRPGKNGNHFDHPEMYEILDQCLSCKACKNECPSSVDMAKLKAEFLSHWYETHRIPFRTKLIANIHHLNRIGAVAPAITNFILRNSLTSGFIRKISGMAPARSLPLLSGKPLIRRAKKELMAVHSTQMAAKSAVFLYVDEFTNFNDGEIGLKAIRLLTRLGYDVILPQQRESARTYISKGLLSQARKVIHQNIRLLGDLIDEETPLLGIEPSAILGFRDEYPDLADNQHKVGAQRLAKHSYLIEEFLDREIELGHITIDEFTERKKHILLHGHCQQKAVASTIPTKKVLSFPRNYTVEEIPSGCCGMAGSFGYEKEHYDLSMKVGELVLFPAVRKAESEVIICAPGTSCRHQIKDGTGRQSLHPVEILYDALKIRE